MQHFFPRVDHAARGAPIQRAVAPLVLNQQQLLLLDDDARSNGVGLHLLSITHQYPGCCAEQ